MAFNPSPEVAAARNIAAKFKKQKVIVFMFDEYSFEYASYGVNKYECNKAKTIADYLFNQIEANPFIVTK